ncbi:MAG TPA: hypothetical protein P5057_03135, partial [Acidobacteriota bacterium]|nr:hypothetical protein [Acidobacteriota bacterium]
RFAHRIGSEAFLRLTEKKARFEVYGSLAPLFSFTGFDRIVRADGFARAAKERTNGPAPFCT